MYGIDPEQVMGGLDIIMKLRELGIYRYKINGELYRIEQEVGR